MTLQKVEHKKKKKINEILSKGDIVFENGIFCHKIFFWFVLPISNRIFILWEGVFTFMFIDCNCKSSLK